MRYTVNLSTKYATAGSEEGTTRKKAAEWLKTVIERDPGKDRVECEIVAGNFSMTFGSMTEGLKVIELMEIFETLSSDTIKALLEEARS